MINPPYLPNFKTLEKVLFGENLLVVCLFQSKTTIISFCFTCHSARAPTTVLKIDVYLILTVHVVGFEELSFQCGMEYFIPLCLSTK